METRGIDVINNDFKFFCKKKINENKKIIVVDNVDNITKKCQLLINTYIKDDNKIFFIFICNNLLNIIESIQSKCVILNMNNFNLNSYVDTINKFLISNDLWINSNILIFMIKYFNFD